MRDRYDISGTPFALEKLGRCAAVGLGIGILLSLFVCIRHVVIGPEAIEKVDTTLGKAVLSYLAGGVLAGGTVGIMLPLARWAWGAAIVGAVAGTLVYGLVGYVYDGGIDLQRSLILGVMVGAPAGVMYRSIFGN